MCAKLKNPEEYQDGYEEGYEDGLSMLYPKLIEWLRQERNDKESAYYATGQLKHKDTADWLTLKIDELELEKGT